jgi:chromosome segregation ATPase
MSTRQSEVVQGPSHFNLTYMSEVSEAEEALANIVGLLIKKQTGSYANDREWLTSVLRALKFEIRQAGSPSAMAELKRLKSGLIRSNFAESWVTQFAYFVTKVGALKHSQTASVCNDPQLAQIKRMIVSSFRLLEAANQTLKSDGLLSSLQEIDSRYTALENTSSLEGHLQVLEQLAKLEEEVLSHQTGLMEWVKEQLSRHFVRLMTAYVRLAEKCTPMSKELFQFQVNSLTTRSVGERLEDIEHTTELLEKCSADMADKISENQVLKTTVNELQRNLAEVGITLSKNQKQMFRLIEEKEEYLSRRELGEHLGIIEAKLDEIKQTITAKDQPRDYREGLSQWLNVSKGGSLNAQAELQEPRVEEGLNQLKERIDSLCKLSDISVHDETSILASCLIRLEKLLEGTKASYVLQQDDVNEVNKMLSGHKTNLEAIEIGAQEGDVFLVNQGFFCRRFTAIAFDLLCTLEPSRKAKPTQSKHSKGGAVGKSLQVNKDKEIENLKEQILAKENKVHQLIEEKQASDKLDAVKEELSKVKQKLTENDEEMNKLTAEHRECSITIAAIKQVEAQIQQRLTEKEAEISRLTSDYSQTGSSTDQVSQLNSEIVTLQKSLASKEKHLTSLNWQYQAAQTSSNESETQLKELKKKLADKYEEIEALTTQHASCSADLEHFEAQIRELSKKIAAKEEQITKSTADLAASAAKNKAELRSLRWEVTEKTEQIAKLTAAAAQSLSCAPSKSKSAEFEFQITNLDKQIAEKDEQLNKLTAEQQTCSTTQASLGEQFEAKLRELNEKLSENEKSEKSLNADLKKCFTDFKQMLDLFVDNISDYDSREQLKSDISQLSLDNSSEFSDLMNYSAKLPELYYTLLEALSQTRPAHTADEQAKLDQEVFSKLSAELVSLKEKLKAYDSQRTHTDSFVDMSPRTPSRSMNLDTSTYSEASDMLIRTLESDIAAYEQKVRALEVKDRESSDIIHSQKLDIESLQHKVATYQAEMHNRTVKVNMGSDPESKKRYFFNWLELKDNEYRSDKQAQFFMRLKHSRLNSSLNESPPPRATEESKQGTNSSFSTQIHETVGPQGEPQQSQE